MISSKRLMYLIPTSPCSCVLFCVSCSFIRCGGEHAGGGWTHHRRSLQATESEQQNQFKTLLRKHGPALLNAYSVLSCSAHVLTLRVMDLSPQVRIEQVIVAEPGAVLLYKLSNLLKFYHHTIRYFNSLTSVQHNKKLRMTSELK